MHLEDGKNVNFGSENLKGTLGRHRHKCEDNIKIDIKYVVRV
jgi:hypothetical protein